MSTIEAGLAVLEPTEAQAVAEYRRDLAKENFMSDFVDARNQTHELEKYIIACSDAYGNATDKYYSPYIALCQSSGWGKSRLIRQLSQRMRVVYFSFMRATSSGYPERVGADFILKNKHRTPEDIADLLLKAARVSRAVPPFDFEVHGKQFWEVVNGKLSVDEFISAAKIGAGGAAMEVDDCDSSQQMQQPSAPVVLVFDEARELLDRNFFLDLRRALTLLWDEGDVGRVFGVFCDTTMRIAKYVPPKTAQPSERAKVGILFHPYLLTGNNDILTRSATFNVCWKEKGYIKHLGRPLWKWVDSNVALQKLTLNKDEHASQLAVMFSRLGSFLQPTCKLAEVLSSNHMATLLAVDNDRTHFLVTYTSEPFLSLAAASQWKEETFLLQGLRALNDAFLHGHVLEGSRGETVGCIIFLHAIDCLEGPMDEWKDLLSFFRHLAGDAAESFLDPNLHDAKILFSHFVPWYRDLNQEDVEELVKRRAACIAQRNQDGVDLILPFWKDELVSDSPTTKYGMVWVQIKNCVHHQDMAKMGYKMHDDYVVPNYDLSESLGVVRIAMELGLERPNPKGSSARVPQVVRISTEPRDDGKTVVSASTAQKTKTVDTNLGSSVYSFLRIKGLKSMESLSEELQGQMLKLLDGPFRPSVWWERNKPGGIGEKLPGHHLHFDSLCFDNPVP